jgi:hypothetical protein
MMMMMIIMMILGTLHEQNGKSINCRESQNYINKALKIYCHLLVRAEKE